MPLSASPHSVYLMGYICESGNELVAVPLRRVSADRDVEAAGVEAGKGGIERKSRAQERAKQAVRNVLRDRQNCGAVGCLGRNARPVGLRLDLFVCWIAAWLSTYFTTFRLSPTQTRSCYAFSLHSTLHPEPPRAQAERNDHDTFHVHSLSPPSPTFETTRERRK